MLYTTYLPTPTSASVQESNRLRAEVVRLKREMQATSSQDEFAKWAKLRRQHDKAEAQYNERGIFSFLFNGLRLSDRIRHPRSRLPKLDLKSWTDFSMFPPSCITEIAPRELHPHYHHRPLARHQRPPLLPPVVVRAHAHVLDPEGLGTVLCSVAAELPKSAGGGG